MPLTWGLQFRFLDLKNDDSEEILTPDDLTVVGIYDGEEIEWINLKEYKNHMKRKDEKGTIGKKGEENLKFLEKIF